MDRISALGCFGEVRPNHVLVNEYLAGQGIMPHTDGPLFTPVITTITLGSHALLDLYTPRDDSQVGTDLQPRWCRISVSVCSHSVLEMRVTLRPLSMRTLTCRHLAWTRVMACC